MELRVKSRIPLGTESNQGYPCPPQIIFSLRQSSFMITSGCILKKVSLVSVHPFRRSWAYKTNGQTDRQTDRQVVPTLYPPILFAGLSLWLLLIKRHGLIASGFSVPGMYTYRLTEYMFIAAILTNIYEYQTVTQTNLTRKSNHFFNSKVHTCHRRNLHNINMCT